MQSDSSLRIVPVSGPVYRIEIIAGSLKGTIYPIADKHIVLGRSPEATIRIDDTLISRRHCTLDYVNGYWFIEDLNSTNGTWLVGQKLLQRAYLPVNTPVRIGKTIFSIFDSSSSSRCFQSSSWIMRAHIPPEEMAVPMPFADAAAAEKSSILNIIYNFQSMLAQIQEERELYPKMLAAVCSVMPSSKVFLLTYDIASSSFAPKAARDMNGALRLSDYTSQFSMEIVNYVKETGESALFSDYEHQFVFAVPLRGKQQINGIFYLIDDKIEDASHFEDLLRLLSILGYCAGQSIEHNRIVEINVRNENLIATGTTAAGLSHHIKNIMAGLDGCVSLLKIGIEDGDKKLSQEAWQILSKNHHRLSNVVLDLLNLSSEQKMNFSVTNVNGIVKDAYELYKDQLALENISFDINDVLRAPPIMAEVDSVGIHRILLNLINNAEHAILANKDSLGMPVRKGMISIRIGFDDSRNYLLIRVQDNGTGVNPAESGKIFDLFISSKGNAGTGLGLAVCKRIAEAHGGTISLHTVEHQGCTFTVSIPVTHDEMSTSTCVIKRII